MPYTEDQIGFKDSPTETTREAAEAMATRAPQLRVKVLEAIRAADEGLTADEVATKLNLSVLAVLPRVTGLHKDGLIVHSCARRPNASGRSATVWVSRGRG